jgi:hypothetical protein
MPSFVNFPEKQKQTQSILFKKNLGKSFKQNEKNGAYSSPFEQ